MSDNFVNYIRLWSVLWGFMGVNQNEENRDILTHNQVVVGSNPTGPTRIDGIFDMFG